MPSQRGYKIRMYVNGRTKNGKEYKNYSLTVPNDIAERLPKDITFVPRMTDEGLLYVPTQNSESQVELPEWAKQNGANDDDK